MSRNILFLSHRLPYPPNKGDKIRSHAWFTHLASQGVVHLGCFIDDPRDIEHLDAVRRLARGNCHFELIGPVIKATRAVAALATGNAISVSSFASERLKRYLRDQFAKVKFDDILVFGSAMAPYVFDKAFSPERVLFDMVDVDSDKWNQYSAASSGFHKWLYKREAVTLLKVERSAARVFGRSLVVSEFEAETFRELTPKYARKIGSLTNGVDLEYFAPGCFDNPFPPTEYPIVMTGHMDYRPNHEGALWFAKEILPLVRRSVPNARAYFVGASPRPALHATAGPHSVVTGRVPDVRPYLQFAGAVIAPLRIARGVQNKVLEAMAMGRPVVATQEATRALAVRSGTHLWVANEPQRFADAVVSAVRGSERERIASAGHHYVAQHHSWPAVLATLDTELANLRHVECDPFFQAAPPLRSVV